MVHKSRIVISDVHGCYKTLLALIAKLPSGVPITFAGDLIDRGPDSRKVIEFVKNGGYDCVLGNHEQMMIDELEFKAKQDGTERIYVDYYHGIWSINGGDKCLLSYLIEKDHVLENGEKTQISIHDIAALKEHVEWLKSLPYYKLYDDVIDKNGQKLLVTHTTAAEAWDIVPTDSREFKDHLIWDRKDYPSKIVDLYNVYGHTPQKDKATVRGHFACIDTGAYFKRQPYGKLTALQFPEMRVFEQENIE